MDDVAADAFRFDPKFLPHGVGPLGRLGDERDGKDSHPGRLESEGNAGYAVGGNTDLAHGVILETERLERCPSTHVTYNPKTGEFKYIPVCSWRLHNKQVLSEIAAAYAEMDGEAEPEAAQAPAATA